MREHCWRCLAHQSTALFEDEQVTVTLGWLSRRPAGLAGAALWPRHGYRQQAIGRSRLHPLPPLNEPSGFRYVALRPGAVDVDAGRAEDTRRAGRARVAGLALGALGAGRPARSGRAPRPLGPGGAFGSLAAAAAAAAPAAAWASVSTSIARARTRLGD